MAHLLHPLAVLFHELLALLPPLFPLLFPFFTLPVPSFTLLLPVFLPVPLHFLHLFLQLSLMATEFVLHLLTGSFRLAHRTLDLRTLPLDRFPRLALSILNLGADLVEFAPRLLNRVLHLRLQLGKLVRSG